MSRRFWLMAVALTFGIATSALAQDTPTYFRQNCMSCHTIGGGRLVGPDLKDVIQRKDRAWLQDFIQNPTAKMNSGDSYALKLRDEARGIVMPTLGVGAERAGMLLDLIAAESKLPASHFKGLQLSSAPFTPADFARGETIFRGAQPLKNGGPACLSCHSLAELGGLGGGKLGPDLTRVYERLQGRAGMSAWLAAPGTVTMRAVFGKYPLEPTEIDGLVAYFQKESFAGAQRTSASQLNFLLFGLGVAVLGLVLMDTIWHDRLRGVRRPMVQKQSSRGRS